MKTRQLFGWLLAALLLVGISAGSLLAQDQVIVPQPSPNAGSNVPQLHYPESGSNGPPQYPDAGSNAPQQYPDAGNNAPPQNAPGQSAQDPPGRVARLQYTSGEVSMQPGGVNDWVAAGLNRPLTTSDRVWTDKNSRAELNVGDGFIRMNSETSLTLTNVSDSTVQLELDQGVLEITVKHLSKGEIYEVDTPNFAFTVMKTGVYVFNVLPYGDQSWVTVRSGNGEATGQGPAVKVTAGQQVRFTSDKTLQHTAQSAPVPDGFEDWAQVRDKRLADSLSARYVSPGVIGYQDLDAYGTWQTTQPYGAIWVPTSVPSGWAPYRYGHWVWIAPWGWTWVDDAPWGFAPFHYGRWVSWNGGWGWAPGPLGYWNPYYAPALVGWIGGAGWGVGFGWGWGFGVSFGWYPLGWGAPYYPYYCGWGHGGYYHGGYYHGGYYHGGGQVSAGYLHNVNVTNTHITNINNVTNNYYHGNLNGIEGNRNIAGAVTAAPKSAFTSGAAINKVGMAVPKGNLGQGQLMHTADVNPTRQSVLGGQRGVAGSTAGLGDEPQCCNSLNASSGTGPLQRSAVRDGERQWCAFDSTWRMRRTRLTQVSMCAYAQRRNECESGEWCAQRTASTVCRRNADQQSGGASQCSVEPDGKQCGSATGRQRQLRAGKQHAYEQSRAAELTGSFDCAKTRRCTGLLRTTAIMRRAEHRSSRLRRIKRRRRNMRLRKDKVTHTAMAARTAVRVRTPGPMARLHGHLPVTPIMQRRHTRDLRRTRRGGPALACTAEAVARIHLDRTLVSGVTDRVRHT